MSRDVHSRLCRAILHKAAPARLVQSRAQPWASVTFTGARHWLALHVAPQSAARVRRDLPEARFDLPGHLVADLEICSEQTQADGVVLHVEALTVMSC